VFAHTKLVIVSRLLIPYWEIICRVLQCCASSSNLTLLSDLFIKCLVPFTNLTFSSIIWSSCMTVTNWYSCWCAVPAHAFHQYCFCITTKILPCAALKFRKFNWLLQIVGKLFGWRSHHKCVAKHLKSWSEQFACLCSPMCNPIWFLFPFFLFID